MSEVAPTLATRHNRALEQMEKTCRRIIVAATIAVAATSGCEVVDITGGDIHPATTEEKRDTVKVVREAILMSAVVYEDGYDWVCDTLYGDVQCRLQLMTEDSVLVSLPVGEEYGAASDPDMHRILDSALYDDWSAKDETIVRRDGKEVFRFSGREMLLDMVLDNGNIITLGASRSGGGFVLRRNGKVTAQSPDIFPATELYVDNGELCFSGVTKDNSWYLVADGKTTLVNHPSEEAIITRLRQFGGKTAITLQLGNSMVLVYDKVIYWIGYDLWEKTTACDIICDGESIYVDGYGYKDDSISSYKVWNKDGLLWEYDAEFEKYSHLAENGVIRTLGFNHTTGLWQIVSDGKTLDLPEGYRPRGSQPMLTHDGSLYISLTDSNNRAALWKDGSVKELGFNGYVDHLASGFVTTYILSTSRY